MSLPPLASITDLEVRLGLEFGPDEAPRAEALIEGASARVRGFTGRTFVQTDYTETLTPCCGRVQLSNGPVISIESVEDADGSAVTYTWNAGRTVLISGPYGPVAVAYVGGWAEVPADVLEVVCQIAGRAFGTTAADGANSEEHLGAYGFTVGTIAAAGVVGLLPDERDALSRYIGGNRVGSITLQPPVGTIPPATW